MATPVLLRDELASIGFLQMLIGYRVLILM